MNVNVSKLSYIMTSGDSLQLNGSGDEVTVYYDSSKDNSFFGNWTCFNKIILFQVSGDFSWLKNAKPEFKTSVEYVHFYGSTGIRNLNISDLSEYTNLNTLMVFPLVSDSATVSMGDISTLESLNYISFRNVNISDLKYLPLEKIKHLELINCGISSIYYLKDCTLLEYLNLNQNPLTDMSYDNTNVNSMQSIKILVDLNQKYALKHLFIEGAMFTNTQELKNLSWTDHSGF